MSDSTNPAAAASHDAHEEHHHSAVPYFVVWIALLIFTALTVWTGHMHLGTWALPLAMTIAITKSVLVMLFFMHLYDQPGPNRMVAGVSFIFVALLLGITLLDVAARFHPATPAGAPYGGKVILAPGYPEGEGHEGGEGHAAPAGEHH